MAATTPTQATAATERGEQAYDNLHEGRPEDGARELTLEPEPILARRAALDIDLVAADLDTAVEALVARAGAGGGGYACFCNVHVVVTARRDEALRDALGGAWAAFADGAPVVWLQRRLGTKAAGRVAGPDVMPAVIERGCARSLRHFLFGSTRPVLETLRTNLTERFPDARIVGSYAPPPDREHDDACLRLLRMARPHVIWCGLGAPKQEQWMSRHAETLRPALLLGVGAAFDFNAGTRQRAPVWMRDHGLEWLHRLASEPRRLSRRYVTTNSRFMALAASELTRHWLG